MIERGKRIIEIYEIDNYYRAEFSIDHPDLNKILGYGETPVVALIDLEEKLDEFYLKEFTEDYIDDRRKR
jgi:hypothetical protein